MRGAGEEPVKEEGEEGSEPGEGAKEREKIIGCSIHGVA